jgi:hypothetical protein
VSLLEDSASGRLSEALLLTKNKGRDTIIKNVKPEGSVPLWKTRETSAQNAAEKQTTP